MRIAMIGQKGIPAVYGGIERHVEEISTLLAQRGHDVFVYCRPYYTPIDGKYKGVNLVKLPSIKTRNLDCASHTLISTAHVLSMKADVVHYHALGPSALSFVPRLTGARTVVTVHGLDWRGGKWGALATWLLQRCEYTACHFPNRTIVVSNILKKYFEDRFGRKVIYVPNGVRVGEVMEPVNISPLGISAGGYYLFVGRLGAEKGCHVLVEAFTRAKTDRKLVMVGSAHLNVAYEERLKALANDRVIFPGAIYGDLLTELWNGAYAVIHPSMTEGMSLSLLEAMAHSKCVIVSNIPENLEVIGEESLSFRVGDIDDLAQVISEIDTDPGAVARYGAMAVTRAMDAFDWRKIVESLEKVYLGT
jgi:glycosyltransferase involved in cell wall biosynthesis